MATVHHHRRAGDAHGLTPESQQQMLMYLAAGLVGLFVINKVVRAVLCALPLAAVVMVLTKPQLHGFSEFLTMVDGKPEVQPPTTAAGLLGLVAKAIKQTASLFIDPANDWLYLDLLVCVVAKRRGERRYALGALNRWLMLDARRLPPNSPLDYTRRALEQLSAWVPDENWSSFASLSAGPGGQAPSITAQVNLSLGGGDPRREFGVMRSRSAEDRAEGQQGQRLGGEERPIAPYLSRAQALAERGRFDAAAQCVEEGVGRVRATLGQDGEEEIQLTMLAAAYYDAGNSVLGQVKSRREAAELWVRRGRWGDAAGLFAECVGVWTREKEAGSNYGALAATKAADLLLDSVLCSVMGADDVKGLRTYRAAVSRDPEVADKPAGAFASAIVEASQQNDSELLMDARSTYLRSLAPGAVLEGWREGALQVVCKRLDAGHLK